MSDNRENVTFVVKQAGDGWVLPGLVIGAVLFGGWSFGLFSNLTGRDDEAQRQEHSQAVHRDDSTVSVQGEDTPDELRTLRPGEQLLSVLLADGEVVTVATKRENIKDFEREILFFLRRREAEDLSALKADISSAFDEAFSDEEEALNAYADWFFAWGRSWDILWRMIQTTIAEVPKSWSRERVYEQIEIDTHEYLMEQYTTFVLKPELRGPQVDLLLKNVMDRAHARVVASVATLDAKQQRFVAEHTRIFERSTNEGVVAQLDWNAQKWKAEDRWMDGQGQMALAQAGAILGGAIAGSALLPVVGQSVAEVGIFSGLAEGVVGSMGLALDGLIAGTLLEPVGGTIIGAGLGVGADWLLSFVREGLEREDFIRDNKTAVEHTKREWSEKSYDGLRVPVENWYKGLYGAVISDDL